MRWAGTWRAAGDLVNLAGYTLAAEVRALPSTTVQETAITLGDQGVAPGTYTVDVTSLELAAGVYTLRVRYTEPGGAIHRSSPIRLEVAAP